MLTLIKLLLFLLTSNTWALSTLEIGSRKAIGSKSGYHFSSKDLVSVQTKLGVFYIVGKKVGLFEYKKNANTYSLLILNKEQNAYFNKVNFIVENSPLLKWTVESGKLIIKGEATIEESSTLLKICSENRIKSISLQIGANPKTSNEQVCLGLSISYHIELAFLNKDLLSGSTYGAGIPAELGWRFQTKFLLDDVAGAVNAKNQKAWAKGHSFFEVDAEVGREFSFESGSEILIRPSGVFTRQQNEWKKALTSFKLIIKEEHEQSVDTSFIIKKNKRSGEEGVFSVENFEQMKTLDLNRWHKIFVFSDKGSLHSKNKLLGLSLLGSRSKSNNTSYKEFWARVSTK